MSLGGVGWRLLDVVVRQTPPLIEFGWEFRVPEPGFARVDPLRGRVSGLLQERESETIDHERSGKIPSAQVSIETGQLQERALHSGFSHGSAWCLSARLCGWWGLRSAGGGVASPLEGRG